MENHTKYTWGSDILNIEEILEKQKDFYRSGKTLPVKFRIQMLLKLYNLFADMPNHLLYIFSRKIKRALTELLKNVSLVAVA